MVSPMLQRFGRASSWISVPLLALAAACGSDGVSSTTGETTGTSGGETSSGTTEAPTMATVGDTPSGTTDETTGTSTGTTTGEVTGSNTDADTGTSTGTTTGDDTSTGTTGAAQSTLCSRLGDEEGIAAVVADFRGRVLADQRINAYFLNADLDDGHLWGCMADHVELMAACDAAEYTCGDMMTVHAGLGISAQDFADFAGDFAQALETAPGETTEEDRAGLLAALMTMSPEIVEDTNNDATLYQRVGRKPALAALIGAPDLPKSFLGRIAADAAINGFFTAVDHTRLATCLTRQFAAIDGPVHYGFEVDAPVDVEPGVGLQNPCRDMYIAHAGLTDDMMEGITIADFASILVDLKHALSSTSIAQPERDALLAAMDPLCADVVTASEKPECPGFYQTDVLAAQGLYAMIPDDAYDGSLTSMRCHSFEVTGDGVDVVIGAELSIGIAHSFIGDLVIKVQNPDLAVLTVLNRPGYTETSDSGVGGPGDSSVLLGVVPVRFADEAPVSAEEMGADLPAKQAVCTGDLQCDFRPSPGKAPGSNFAGFKGSSAVGTWKVCVGDAGPDHIGNVNSIGLTIQQQKHWP